MPELASDTASSQLQGEGTKPHLFKSTWGDRSLNALIKNSQKAGVGWDSRGARRMELEQGIMVINGNRKNIIK